MEPGNELDILQKAENIVGSDVIPHTVETKVRLLSLISEDLPQVDIVPSGGDAICRQVIEVPKKSLTRNEETIMKGDWQPEAVKSQPIDDSKPAARAGGRKHKDKVPQPKAPAAAEANETPSNDAKVSGSGEEVGGIGGFKSGSSVTSARGCQQSKVPLKDAAASGCLKCKKELETGEKTRNSHSDQCPRKVVFARSDPTSHRPPKSPSITREPAPEIGPDWTKQVERRKPPSTLSDTYFFSPEGMKFRSMAAVRRHLSGGDVHESNPPTSSTAAAAKLTALDVPAAIMSQPATQNKVPQKPQKITLPSGQDTISAPAPEIGPGWLQQVTRRKTASGVSNNRSDRFYISPDGKKCTWAQVENHFRKLGAEKDGHEPRVTFHCDNCGEDIIFSDAQTAGAEFAEHVNNCGQEMNGNNAKGSRRMLARGDSTSSLSTSNTLGGQASLDETLSDGVRGYAFHKNEISLDELQGGQRVLVRCERGQDWQAKILRRNEKNGVPGYNIHYKGSKRKDRKSKQDWVSADKIVALQDEDNE